MDKIRKVVVSACLLGVNCRYDGKTKACEAVIRKVAEYRNAGVEVVEVCPEELGGLPTPRDPQDLRGGDGHDVLAGRATVQRTTDDSDVTGAFLRGVERSFAKAAGAQVAILKARSPSCGIGQTNIDGRVADGDGVFAALCRQEGLHLICDEDL